MVKHKNGWLSMVISILVRRLSLVVVMMVKHGYGWLDMVIGGYAWLWVVNCNKQWLK